MTLKYVSGMFARVCAGVSWELGEISTTPTFSLYRPHESMLSRGQKVPVALPFRLAFPSCFCQKVYASAVSKRLMKKLIHFTAKPLLEVIYYQVSLHVRKYFGESLIFAFSPFFFSMLF